MNIPGIDSAATWMGVVVLIPWSYILDLIRAQHAYRRGEFSILDANDFVRSPSSQTTTAVIGIFLNVIWATGLIIGAGWWAPAWWLATELVMAPAIHYFGNPLLGGSPGGSEMKAARRYARSLAGPLMIGHRAYQSEHPGADERTLASAVLDFRIANKIGNHGLTKEVGARFLEKSTNVVDILLLIARWDMEQMGMPEETREIVAKETVKYLAKIGFQNEILASKSYNYDPASRG